MVQQAAAAVLASFGLSVESVAQITDLGSTGVAQVIPDPLFSGPDGAGLLRGVYCDLGNGSTSDPGVALSVVGLPTGFTNPAVSELIVLGLATGPVDPVGVSLLGGTLYLQGTPVLVTLPAARVLGAVEVAGVCGLGVGSPIPILATGASPFPSGYSFTSIGSFYWLPVPVSAVGVFSMQAFVFNPLNLTYYWSNAISFSAP